jgi:predicted Zn-dependent protease
MSEQCGHDPATYIAYMKRFNEKYAVQVERYRMEHPVPPTEVALTGD